MLKRAIVVGASSGIGAALVRRLVGEGYRVAAVARRRDVLETLCDAVNGPGQPQALPFVHDVRAVEEAPTLFEDIVGALDGLDLVLYSAGIMPPIGPDEYDIEKDRRIVEVNLVGAMSWLDLAAQRFQAQGSGMIVGIGSVAGERGRRGNPAYAASKAALHTFLEALRNRLAPHGVHVLTVKPGPVHTPMTEGVERLPMAIEADAAAGRIFGAIARRSQVTYVPFQWAFVMTAIRSIPSVVFRRMDL